VSESDTKSCDLAIAPRTKTTHAQSTSHVKTSHHREQLGWRYSMLFAGTSSPEFTLTLWRVLTTRSPGNVGSTCHLYNTMKSQSRVWISTVIIVYLKPCRRDHLQLLSRRMATA